MSIIYVLNSIDVVLIIKNIIPFYVKLMCVKLKKIFYVKKIVRVIIKCLYTTIFVIIVITVSVSLEELRK